MPLTEEEKKELTEKLRSSDKLLKTVLKSLELQENFETNFINAVFCSSLDKLFLRD